MDTVWGMEAFTKQAVVDFRDEARKAIELVAMKHGIRVSKVGTARWGLMELSLGFEFEPAAAEPEPVREWRSFCELSPGSGLKAEWLGELVKANGTEYRVAGLEHRRNRGARVMLVIPGDARPDRRFFVPIPPFVALMNRRAA